MPLKNLKSHELLQSKHVPKTFCGILWHHKPTVLLWSGWFDGFFGNTWKKNPFAMIGFVICLILRSAKATLEWFDGLFGSAGRHSLVPNDVWVSLLILRSAEARVPWSFSLMSAFGMQVQTGLAQLAFSQLILLSQNLLGFVFLFLKRLKFLYY